MLEFLFQMNMQKLICLRKFGALPGEALGLLRLAKGHAKKVGLSFHVGSQCMHPISYAKGIREIGNIIKKTKIIP